MTPRVNPSRIVQRRLAAAGAVLLSSIAFVLPVQDGEASFDTTGYPEPMVAAAKLTEQRCTKCHTIKRVVTARYTADQWRDCVDRMAQKEKSGISRKDSEAVTGFLAFHTQKRPASPSGAKPVDPNLGGPAVFPLPENALFASAPLAVDEGLPAKLDLSGESITVESVSVVAGTGSAVTVSAAVVCGDVKGEVSLARDEAGDASAKTLTIRSWKIGPHALSLHVALYSAEAPFSPSARPFVKLATLVVRDAD